MMKTLRQYYRALLLLLLMLLVAPSAAHADLDNNNHQSLHDVYLANTEHELHVFRIFGKKPGKTIMLIGGIQGDEPGGYLTADLYADITLKQGNLIVVPRANFYSILLNQRNGMTGDMNRKFGEKEASEKNLEQEIVTILKRLIGEADCLLNLHEGSGFFHPQWINEMENPDRFGQSIIYDAAEITVEETGRKIDLAGLAERVIRRVNPQIEDPRHHFRANDHNTISTETHHKEQRKSATYYALTRAHIPAFGIETSKSIRVNGEKVYLQKMVVNAFMDEFGIIPETPGLHMEKTELDYVLVKVNDGLPYAVSNGSTIEVKSGDEVVITDIIANFDRGLTADFLDMGSYNDTMLPFRITQPTRVIIRKDAETCGFVEITTIPPTKTVIAAKASGPEKQADTDGGIAIKVAEKQGEPTVAQLRAEKLLLNLNGTIATIEEGNELPVPRDGLLLIKGIQSNISRLDNDIFVNLKGFAPPKRNNDGNDINFPVYPDQDLWVRYSENQQGKRYPIHATYNDKLIGKFWIRLLD